MCEAVLPLYCLLSSLFIPPLMPLWRLLIASLLSLYCLSFPLFPLSIASLLRSNASPSTLDCPLYLPLCISLLTPLFASPAPRHCPSIDSPLTLWCLSIASNTRLLFFVGTLLLSIALLVASLLPLVPLYCPPLGLALFCSLLPFYCLFIASLLTLC
jgi:hypothetical protein